jgi:ABC-type Fe3+ transport system permease subunit
MAVCLALLALPPALGALGVIASSGALPSWTDPVLRSRFTVSVILGIRFFPISALQALRAWASMPSTWALAAGMHGISLTKYLTRIVIPFLLPSVLVSFLTAALLATADITTVLLLHPPGQPSFPLTIFTIMANAPESLVASLCLLYVGGAAGVLGLIWYLARKDRD